MISFKTFQGNIDLIEKLTWSLNQYYPNHSNWLHNTVNPTLKDNTRIIRVIL